MKPIFIQYPKCGTCRKAAKWLKENGIDFEQRDITIDNPTEKELPIWIKSSGLKPAKFFNTSGLRYKELNIKETVKTLDDENLIKILASEGMLVKRPLLVTDKIVLVGFNESEWSKYLL